MTLPPYAKPHATPHDWVMHLRARGLIIPRPNIAAKKIELVGYERLRIYFRSRRDASLPNKPFHPNTSYKDILRIYEADDALRTICFQACGAFELAFRNAISEALSHRHGSHPHRDPAAFNSPADRRSALALLATVYDKSRDKRADHYLATYGSPVLPPIWTLKEFLTFGAAARFYQLLAAPVRADVAHRFGVGPTDVFKNWVTALVDLRNVCAHHDRLFNRTFQKVPSRLKAANVPVVQTAKLKAALECLDYMLDKRGAPIQVVARARRLIGRYPQIQASEAGW